uniref:Uncharacterized protein n=1 Tax=Anguilla anguilla TaxID=7936 RepID=A0A0E9SMS6_ANGAN
MLAWNIVLDFEFKCTNFHTNIYSQSLTNVRVL